MVVGGGADSAPSLPGRVILNPIPGRGMSHALPTGLYLAMHQCLANDPTFPEVFHLYLEPISACWDPEIISTAILQKCHLRCFICVRIVVKMTRLLPEKMRVFDQIHKTAYGLRDNIISFMKTTFT